MINYFFIIVFIVSLVYGLASGNINQIEEALLTLPTDAIKVFFKMAVILVFFQGILEIAKDSGLISLIAKFTNKLIKPLFPRIDDKETLDYISLNLICNFFGIGQAATSAGFKAMERLSSRTKDLNCSQEIITFLSLNTSGFCLIPQTIVALRESYKSASSSAIVLPTFLVSLAVFLVVGLISFRCRNNEY